MALFAGGVVFNGKCPHTSPCLIICQSCTNTQRQTQIQTWIQIQKWLLVQSIVLLKRQKVSVHLPSAVSNLAHLSEKPPNYFSSPVKQTHGLYFLEIYFRSSALQPVGPSSKSRQCIEAECWRKPPTYWFFLYFLPKLLYFELFCILRRESCKKLFGMFVSARCSQETLRLASISPQLAMVLPD